MLRYYTYYSIGGYKDLYLGSYTDKYEGTYYLPLLPVLEAEAQTDPDARQQFEALNALPKICQLSDKERYGLPDAASVLFSHAGYKMIYRHVSGKAHALALRDITCGTKDEMGRNIPFLMVLLGDTFDDVMKLDVIATYFASYMKETEQALSEFLGYDKEHNGLCFKLSDFNAWIDDIFNRHHSYKVVTRNSVIRIQGDISKVALLVLPEGINPACAATEQNISEYVINSVNMNELVSKRDTEQLVNQLEETTEELDRIKAKYSLLKKIVLGALVLGFLFGLLIKSCSGSAQ